MKFQFGNMAKNEESIFPDILTSEEEPEIRITNKRECFYCHFMHVSEEVICCPVCRFPQNGLLIEQKSFIQDAREKAARHLQLEYTIGWAQTVLLFTGLSAIIFELVSLLNFSSANLISESMVDSFWYSLLAALPNIALWFWSKKKPFYAILTALILTAAGTLLQIILVKFNLTSFLFPVLMMVVFVHALLSYKETLEIEKELIFPPQKMA